VASSSSNAPANLITILIGVRFAPRFPTCVKILHGLPGGAFPEIVETGDDDEAASGFIQGESDIAEIGVCNVLQFRQRARGQIRIMAARRRTCDRAPQRLPRLAAPRDSRRSWTEFARERQQMRRKHDLIFRETGMLEDLGRIAVA